VFGPHEAVLGRAGLRTSEVDLAVRVDIELGADELGDALDVAQGSGSAMDDVAGECRSVVDLARVCAGASLLEQIRDDEAGRDFFVAALDLDPGELGERVAAADGLHAVEAGATLDAIDLAGEHRGRAVACIELDADGI